MIFRSSGESRLDFLQVQIDQGGRGDGRHVDDRRFHGLRRHVVLDRQVEDVKRGVIPLLRPPLFGPPRLAQDVRHPAEVFARRFPRRTGIEEAADLLVAAGQNVHDDQQLGKVEGGVPRVERLEEAAAHVEPLPEPLPAVDRAVPPPADMLRRPAGEAPVRFLPVGDRDKHAVHVFLHRLTRAAAAPLSFPPAALRSGTGLQKSGRILSQMAGETSTDDGRWNEAEGDCCGRRGGSAPPPSASATRIKRP